MSAQLGFWETPPAPIVIPRIGALVPRPYQQACLDANARAFREHRRVLDVMATGTGKGPLAAWECQRRGGGMIAVHVDALVKQASQKLRHLSGCHVGVEKAGSFSEGNAYVVGSVQTLRGKRLQDFKVRHPHLSFIVADEAHVTPTKSWGAILEAFPDAQVLGQTATPDRLDGKGLRRVFSTVGFEYPIVQATEEAWLTEGRWVPVLLDKVTLEGIKIRGGDLDQGQLDARVVQCAAEVALAVIQHAKGRRSLIFTPGVLTAMAAAAALNELQPGCARAIHAGMDDKERDDIELAHKNGEFPYLLNCQIYLLGYDDPKIECVFDFAKTMSRLRWAQKYGRLTRLWPHGIEHLLTVPERLAAIAASPKPLAYFFDAQYGNHDHDLAGPLDLLGSDYSPAERKRATDILNAPRKPPSEGDEASGPSVREVLQTARLQLQEEQHRLLAIARAAAKARGEVEVLRAREAAELYGRKPRSPFELLRVRDPETNPWAMRIPGPATEGQLRFLAAYGVPVPKEGMSRRRVVSLIGDLKKREAKGKASFRQIECLAKMGVECSKSTTFEWAKRMISEMDRRAALARGGT